ncbi:unnamed protein product [Medioppia subpectinata]|uniref:E3 ubiquitin-protein ligase n=1 Tax=Medioppia subpectinata TaxID=1979941 RepID=A0A7R9Q101_9ACAR|nr:unnamed protein product [Medioppia subpectinata]CAG2108546.1 unnamed protein product [Medioppia subpectinata]
MWRSSSAAVEDNSCVATSGAEASDGHVFECAVCLDRCLNGVRLDCRHVFCYLCVKGSAQQSNNRCPVCRHPIAHNYFDRPDLIGAVHWRHTADDDRDDERNEDGGDGSERSDDNMEWQYEGRNGWWLYDCRTSRDIHKAYKANEPSLEVLVAGFVYVIDLQRMIQYRRLDPNRIRRIRRQPLDPTTKGVAGLRTQFSHILSQTHSSSVAADNSNESQPLDGSEDTDTHEDNCGTQSADRASAREAVDEEVLSLEQAFNANLNVNDS